MRSRCYLALAGVGILSGCVGLSSEINTKEDGTADGVAYNLPRSLLTVAVWQYHDPDTSRTWYSVGGAKTDTNGTVTPQLNIDAKTIPDPGYRYAIKYNQNPFSDDRLCISRTPTGLLHDVQFASDDRVPEIAFNIARFVAGAGPKQAALLIQTGTQVRTRGYSGQVDPFDPDSIQAFNNGLSAAFGHNLELDFSRAEAMVQRSRDALPKSCSRRGGCRPEDLRMVCRSEHICYRTKMWLPLELKLGPKGNAKTLDMNYAEMVNIYDIGAVSVTRAMLVHKISKFRFQEGALVAAIVRKPSEVEELTLLPIHVINAALITPSGLWAAAFGSSTQDKTTMLNKMTELTNSVQSLELKVAALTAGGPTFDPGNDVKYTLDCSGTGRGTPINFITNPNGN